MFKIMKRFFDPPKTIIVDREETQLLCYWMTNNGLIFSVSGPKEIVLDEHFVTDKDGIHITESSWFLDKHNI